MFLFFKQKTAYEMRISDWSSDVCSSDLILCSAAERDALKQLLALGLHDSFRLHHADGGQFSWWDYRAAGFRRNLGLRIDLVLVSDAVKARRSEEHTSELQSLMRISYAVFCLKKKKQHRTRMYMKLTQQLSQYTQHNNTHTTQTSTNQLTT